MDPKGVIAKSSEVRNLFSLGDSECVVQDYHCQQGWSPLGGRLFICLWTLCWRASVGDTQWSVRLEQVEDCVASKSALILDRALVLKLRGVEETLHFGSFVSASHRDEALAIINHLVKHPLQFLPPTETKMRSSAKIGSGSSPEDDTSLRRVDFSADLELPIVYKLDDDSLQLESVKISSNAFEMGGASYLLSDILEIRVRSRPLHCDILFHNILRTRVRFMSSQIQTILNQLWLRAGRKLVVVFEPGPLKAFSVCYDFVVVRQETKDTDD